MSTGPFFFCWVLALSVAVCGSTAQIRSRAVVVGIHNYTNDVLGLRELKYAHKDARIFADYLGKQRAGEFRQADIRVLRDDHAKLFSTRSGLNKAIAGAQPGEYVYLFISARGIALPGWKDGYIVPSNAVAGKPESTAISVSELGQLIRLSNADRVFLFADVCRWPASSDRENRINRRLEETLSGIPKLGGVLASQAKKMSIELDDLTYGTNEPGFGVFGHSLVTGFQGQVQGRGVTLEQVFNYLRTEIPLRTERRQLPRQLGGDESARERLWRIALGGSPLDPSHAFPRFPISLAMLGGLTRAPLWLRVDVVTRQEQQPPSPSFLGEDTLPDPERAVRDFEEFSNSQHSPDVKEDWRDRLAAKLADQGQDVVARYGAGDQFPNEPGKLGKSDFELAARSFGAALSLVPEGKPWQKFRQSLHARKKFCEGRAKAFTKGQLQEARRILMGARNIEEPPIPEIDNALGITYLEYRESPADLDKAIYHFRLAKTRSPSWAYPRHNLALAYIEQGDYRAAEQEYHEAIEMSPQYPYLYYNLGLLLHRANRLRRARDQYMIALSRFQAAIEAYQERRGQWREQLPVEAALAGKRADALEQNRGEVYNNLGALMERLGKVEAAIEYYNEALCINRDLHPARHNLALLHQKQADTRGNVSTEAIRLLEKNVKEASDFHPSRLALARLYVKQGKTSEAKAHYRAVVHHVQGNTEARVELAKILTEESDFQRAIPLLTDAIQIQTEEIAKLASTAGKQRLYANPEIYEALAEVYAKRGDHRAACKALGDAVHALKGSVYAGNRKSLRRKEKACGEGCYAPGGRPSE